MLHHVILFRAQSQHIPNHELYKNVDIKIIGQNKKMQSI